VLDSLGGDILAKSLAVLKPGGLAISVVGHQTRRSPGRSAGRY
jgi:NADPH:quinone reductase-like Zn-dependent oxidoreductase